MLPIYKSWASSINASKAASALDATTKANNAQAAAIVAANNLANAARSAAYNDVSVNDLQLRSFTANNTSTFINGMLSVGPNNGSGNIAGRTPSGFWEFDKATKATGWPVDANNWFNLITSTHSNGSNYYSLQISASLHDNTNLYWRSTMDDGLKAWNTIWSSGNFDPNSKASLNANVFFTRVTSNESYINSGGDAILTFEDGSANTSSYRIKRIISSKNVGDGNDWLFRKTRPSDGATIDAILDSAGTIFTTGNFNPNSKANLSGANFTGPIDTTGGYISIGRTAERGGIYLWAGTSFNSGYIEFYRKGSVARDGYIGYSDGNVIELLADNGTRYNFTGNKPLINGNVIWDASNFNPNSKANLSGAEFTGDVSIRNSSNTKLGTLFLGNAGHNINFDGNRYNLPGAALRAGSITYDRALQLPSGTDLNTVSTPGFYDGPSLVNAPNSSDWFYTEVQGHSNNGDNNKWLYQRSSNLTGTAESYFRVSQSGNWSDWRKILTDKNRPKDWYNVKELGLNGIGGDDTVAWSSIIDKVPHNSIIYFPAGEYVVTGGINITNKSITIVGAGPKVTTIRLNAANTTLINVNLDNILKNFKISNITLMSGGGTGNKAISITKPNPGVFEGPVIEHVDFVGTDPNSGGFSTCIEMSDCTSFRVLHCQATGRQENNGVLQDMTFVLLKRACTDGTVFDCRIANADFGVYAIPGSNCEGVQIGFNKFVGCRKGVYLDDGVGAPGYQIVYNHLNCDEIGIRTVNRPQGQIIGNLIYKYNDGDFIAIQFDSLSVFTSIQGNQICGFGTQYQGTSVGIIGGSSNRCLILDNQFDTCKVGIDLTNSCAGVDDRNMFINTPSPRQGMNASGHVLGTAYTFNGM